MRFYSTNNHQQFCDLKTAVIQGLAPDNGLYMPESILPLPQSFWASARNLSFQEISFAVANQLLKGSIEEHLLQQIVSETLSFDAPLIPISDKCYSLELFHGPTLAFKDFGARFMARVMSHFVKDEQRKLKILVATSGDTGGAVADGFYKTDNIEVIILFPKGKVSFLQEKQLTTLGENITAIEVNGDFDTCQALVKQAFLDQELRQSQLISSANSINIARLIPQSFYYAYTSVKLANPDRRLVYSVPSGNFGNLTAGLIAQILGAPIDQFLAATNANDTVPRYLDSGAYEVKPTVQTISNAMDVSNPSNFVRMQDLFGGSHREFTSKIIGQSVSDQITVDTMKEVYNQTNYILDPHGAVAYKVLNDFLKKHPEFIGVFLETAHPAKFLETVEENLQISVEIPKELECLRNKEGHSIKIEPRYEILRELLLS